MSKTQPGSIGLYDPRFEHDACGVGFVANVKGRRSREIITQALSVLENLRHRGACGCEVNTGDGAGILLQIPHEFLLKATHAVGIHLPAPGQYGVGTVFLPRDRAVRRRLQRRFEAIVNEEDQRFLGWRRVPTIHAGLGRTARACEPAIFQAFIGRDPDALDLLEDDAFERKLYVIRRRAEQAIRYGGTIAGGEHFYVASLSMRTIVYKGMLMAEQLGPYFPDLLHPSAASALAIVHSRFSTNTFPSWERAHPYRYLAHNGEINTLRGNINWFHTREAMLQSQLFGAELKKVLPIIAEDGSDSGMFDNAFELLILAGRSLPHAMMMMIPEPWQHDETMSAEKRAFYEFHSSFMEAWDGPAAVAFTDGIRLGATLDRNGLRPARYYVTDDDRVILASEVGVLDVPPERIVYKGRLQPGRMLLIDTEAGRIVDNDELKQDIATQHPYQDWLESNLLTLADLRGSEPKAAPAEPTDLRVRQKAFGYTTEELRLLLGPMARSGVEAIGSMGTDTPLAVLSNRPQLLYNYFKQLFAQVTNPPIDAIREAIVTATRVTVGPERNLLHPVPEAARLVSLPSPVLTNTALARIRSLDTPGLRAATIPILWNPEAGGSGLEEALEDVFDRADQAIDDGFTILILSDRGVLKGRAPIPALLATSALHHHLIRDKRRTRAGLIVESGEVREVHHIAMLVGFGAVGVNPYLALETIADLVDRGHLPEVSTEEAVANYIKAAVKGLVKILSKMGISTVQSYCGAGIFEAIGLSETLVRRYFNGTPTRLGGIGIDVLAEEIRLRHAAAWPGRSGKETGLPAGGEYQWRKDGAFHLTGPRTVHLLQRACRENNYQLFKKYTRLVDDQSEHGVTLRSLLNLAGDRTPVPLEEVEPVTRILRRFKTGAMSYGSISKEAHESLAIAMNRIGGRSNTGEGGEDPSRYTPDPNGDSRNSAIKQVASGRFGVTSEYLVKATEIQIKMAQGAKPGEGGQLPGHKVYPWIAKVRFSSPGVGLISPPPHHDIYSIEDLAQLIHDLKNANRHARISVKLVSTIGVGTIAAGVAKAHADVILISGYDGGTGASPLTSIKHTGAPWELGLAETHQTLQLNELRSRVTLETDGQLRTGRDVVVAALLGAEEFGFATAPLIVLGCIMMRACHKNTCPVGVATQNPELRKRFTGDPAHVVGFMRFVAQEVRELMAGLGFRTVDEMIGRSDLLRPRRDVTHWKAKHLDLEPIVKRVDLSARGEDIGAPRHHLIEQDHGLADSLDNVLLLDLCEPALERGEPVRATLPVRNINRVVGTMVGAELTRRHGSKGLPSDTIRLHFQGSAGQSFGAFLPPGMTLLLEGDCNDYIGKGLSGGRIIVYPPGGSTFEPESNMLVGNVAFYGATGGEAFIRGMAGERFCVRNSGASAVVEAVGDHGCEYMTGGRVVVLGPTGRNFAAGMSGGIAYVLDRVGDFEGRCNREMVDLEGLDDPEEAEAVRALVRRHAVATGSELGRRVLAEWPQLEARFVKVIPRDYKRVLESMAAAGAGEAAAMAAFERNLSDRARRGGT